MMVKCPHCSAGFQVADERAETPDAAVTCPECLESFSLAGADEDEIDFTFDLDGAFSTGGFGSHSGMTGSGLGDLDELALEDDENDRSGSFSGAQEVSHLNDVDLTMIGTYHRTGRVLHHATDVVWTERPRDGAEPPEAPGPLPKAVVDSTAAPPQRSESQVRALIDAPTMSAFPPLEEGDGDDLGLADLEPVPSAPSSPPPSAPPPPAGAASDGGAGFDLGGDSSEMLEEMDFSSLLEDSVGSRSLFGEDSNPFLKVGITSDSVSGPGPGGPPAEAEDALFQSDDDTNTFFIEAPSVGKDEDAPEPADGRSLEISGTFELDVPMEGGPAQPAAQKTRTELPPSAVGDKKAPPRRAAPASKGSSSRGAVVAAALLLVVTAGVGLAGVALDEGWFFSNIWMGEDESGEPGGQRASKEVNEPKAKPGGSASQTGPQRATVKSLKDNKQRVVELSTKAKSAEAGHDVKDELLRLHLRFRYRWPGRLEHDSKRRTEIKKLLASKDLSNLAKFWDLVSRVPGKDETRDDLLRKAKLELDQVDASGLPPGRDLLYKAVHAKEMGRTDERELDSALSLLDLALKENPTDTWALYEKADLLAKRKKFDDAEVTLDALLRIDPKNLDGQVLAAEVWVARQTPEAYARARELAEKAHAQAVEAKDGYGEYRANLVRAVVYGLQNDLGKRLEALEGAARFDPRDEMLLLELAKNDLKKGMAKKAAERLKDCGKGVCSSVDYYKTHIKILFVGHKLTEADRVVVAAEAAYPDNADLLFWSGQILEARGKLSLAARKYAAVKQKDPRYLEAYLRLAGIHRREKRFEEAISVLKEASKVFEGAGKDSDAALALLQEHGELLIKQGRLDSAREVFGKIVLAQPNNAPARVRLAKLLTELGYPQKALPHFEKLYEQGKSDPDVNITYAEALIRSGKPDRAIEELTAFLEHNPKDLNGLVKLGHAYVQRQRYEDAIAVLQHAAALNPNFAPAYYFAGLAELGKQRQKSEEVDRKERIGEVVREENKPDFTAAIIALTTARDKSPENLDYRKSLAEALTESGRENYLAVALEEYNFILEKYRDAERFNRPIKRSAEVYFNRGLIASKLGRPRAEVLKNFRDALGIDAGRADFLARYAEELYRMQSKRKQEDGRYVVEAKAYFELVLRQHNPNHIRANYYMGRIMLLEWDKQRHRKPGDALHGKALEYFERVVKHDGAEDFPEVLLSMGHILRDRQVYRMANKYFEKYLKTYRRVHQRDPPNARDIRDLMRK